MRSTNIILNDLQLCEYAVYHWNFKESVELIGVHDGFPDENFFGDIEPQNLNSKEIYGSLSDILDETVLNWSGFKNDSLIMCSGGVDSSILVAGAFNTKCNFELIHTAYVNHDNNDLDKLKGVMEHFPAKASIYSLGHEQYFEGLNGLWNRNYIQNTYAPTTFHALSSSYKNNYHQLITGSGPDELFYGMEKYDWNHFKNLDHLNIAVALEKIDVAYNLTAYSAIMNKRGHELMAEVQLQRRRLYQSIGKICTNIFDAQRMLAYCTVTAQHVSLFDKLSQGFGLKHRAPFLNKELIYLAFSLRCEQFLHRPNGEINVEIGKRHLKDYATKFYNNSHIFSKKIGFHAPVNKFIHQYLSLKNQDLINYDFLPSFLDRDLTKKYVNSRLEQNVSNDYFFYSIINLVQLALRQ